MEAEATKILEQQRDTWNAFSGGWKKWDNWVMKYIEPLGTEIINHLNLKATDRVLDVATGTGEPGLSIAKIVSNGKVVGTDISEKMIEIAEENAEKRNVRNYKAIVADVCDLPFEDNSFDAISCRFGFMFFPDMSLAAKEMARVLHVGGTFATSVWGTPEKNFWVTSIMGPVSKNMNIAPPPPGSPGMFRCTDKNMMIDLFKKAGFSEVNLKEVNTSGNVESFEHFWEYMNDVAAPVASAMSKADDKMKLKIKSEVAESFMKKFARDKDISMEYQAYLIYGTK